MAAEWITRGAGPRDSRELLTALDNLGVSHAESAQTLHTSLAGATLSRNLVPALEIVADMVLHPHLEEDEFEPIRALCLQNLRSLEDDPGSKVIYELRRRHFPDPWGRPSPGTTGRGIVADAGGSARISWRHPIGLTVRSWVWRERSTGRGFVTASASFSAGGRHSLRRKWWSGPPVHIAITSSARRSKSRSPLPIPRRRSQPRLLSGAGHHGDPGRLFLGPAFHRGP